MKKFLSIMLATVFIFSILTACSNTSQKKAPEASDSQETGTIESTDVKVTEVKFSHVFAEDHPVHLALLEAADLLKEKSGGRYELKIYSLATYANYKDSIQAVKMDTLEFCALDNAMDYLPESGVMLAPYLFRNLEHWDKFKQSDVAVELRDKISEAVGVKQLQFYNFGFRHATTNGEPATTPEEFEGTKMRVVDFAPYPEVATVLNTIPTPLPIGDVYMALNGGVADAQENPLTQIKTMKFYEVQDNLILTEHILATSGTIASQKFWDSLSPEDQKMFEEVFDAEAQFIDDMVKNNEEALLQEMIDAGMNVVEVDKQPFMDRVSIVLEKYPEWVDLYNEIQAIK